MDKVVRFDVFWTDKIAAVPRRLKPAMFAITLCGSTLPILIILSLEYLHFDSPIKRALIFIAISILLNLALKQYLHRPRPDTLYVSRMRFKTHSFPSGHSFGSIITYGFLAYLALINLNAPLSLFITALCLLLVFLIGISRVYLGAHYPTDVIGGWVLGAACLIAAVLIS
jgi:undecaprenyl-diphosphatase